VPARLLEPATTTAPAAVPAAAPGRAGLRSLPEVRWAAAATALFAAGLVIHFAGGPGWLAWVLFLACCAGDPIAGRRGVPARALNETSGPAASRLATQVDTEATALDAGWSRLRDTCAR
jgi:hypothetical protein